LLSQTLKTLAEFDVLPESLNLKNIKKTLLGVDSFDELINYEEVDADTRFSNQSRVLQAT